ncbi:hypothetical protein U1Q18_025462 [Sarracenia purpurea var. burkii]
MGFGVTHMRERGGAAVEEDMTVAQAARGGRALTVTRMVCRAAQVRGWGWGYVVQAKGFGFGVEQLRAVCKRRSVGCEATIYHVC